MLAQPVLSVVTASRDRRDLLLGKLASLRRQTLQPGLFEWLVCLDASTDDSKQALEAALATAPPPFGVKIVESLVRIGPGPARNRAVEGAGGRVLYFSDDDCMPEPGCLERHLQAQAQPAVYVGAITFRDGDKESLWSPRNVGWWNVNGANTSVPMGAFLQAGGFPDYLEGYGGEDLALGWALTRDGLQVEALPDALTVHEGPATGRGHDPERWFEAGANAMRLATVNREMANRLGVERWQLALKRIATPFMGRRGRLEAEYARGALSVRRKEQS